MELSSTMAAAARTARRAACAGIVLLKNTGSALPLLPHEDGTPLSVAVFGAAQLRTPVCEPGLSPVRTSNILDGLLAAEGLHIDALLASHMRTRVLQTPDAEEYCPSGAQMADLAQSNDAAVVVIGRDVGGSITLRGDERALISAVRAAFVRTVLVIAAPGFVELSEDARACSAVVFLGLAGQEAGYALADVLTAQALPTGRLAFTWPLLAADCDEMAARADAFRGWRYYDSFGRDVLYPFGWGLGYGAMALGSVSAGLDGCDVVVSAEAENTGAFYPDGTLVQVYVTRPDGDRTQPVRTLAAAARTKLLAPGETQLLSLRFPVGDLAVYRQSASAFVLDAGLYDISVGTDCRSACVAGTIRVTRSAVTRAAEPVRLPDTAGRDRPEGVRTVSPGEEDSLAFARSHAIRFSDRDLPRHARKKGRAFTGCRSDGQTHTLSDVRTGACSVFHLVAAMEDAALRTLVDDFGRVPSAVPGAMGASAALPLYGIPSVQLACGTQGLQLAKEVPDGDAMRRQYVTVFPAPSQLACSFDRELIRAVGEAVGREMRTYGVQLWMGPGANLQRSPRDASFSGLWSEDPLVCGLCASALAEGVRPHGEAVLHLDLPDGGADVPADALFGLYARSLALACTAFRAARLPDGPVSGQTLTAEHPLVRAWVLDCRYRGMFFSGRPTEGGRTALEKNAVRIVQLLSVLPQQR